LRPTAEQTTNIERGQAFAHDGLWAGFVVFPAGASTGWHHHGDYATYGYVTSGAMTVEFGPVGSELVEIGEGDFICIPAHLIHRESVAPDGGAGVIVRVGGVGATVFNIEGPDPATWPETTAGLIYGAGCALHDSATRTATSAASRWRVTRAAVG
jgi:uncharacterized RmlC-like cupin family protein